MTYMEEYKARNGKCEYCKNSDKGENFCAECWGYGFDDRLDFMGFVKKRVSEQASETFDETEEGKRLLAEYNKREEEYFTAKDAYEKARDLFVDNEVKKPNQNSTRFRDTSIDAPRRLSERFLFLVVCLSI